MQEQQEDRMDRMDTINKSHPSYQALAALAGWRQPFRGKTRAGYTTNKGRGTPKAKRKQVAASRHHNRGK